MNHSFNVTAAKLYGVENAIIIENLYFWIEKNEANEKHFYEGDYWTYNSVKAFTKLFPYWTPRQIERILKSLEEKGAVKTGNFNKLSYDRTKWYALTKTVKCIYANGEMDLTGTLNGNTQTVEPIPDINTDINTDINIYIYVYNYYLTKPNLIKHKELTIPIRKAIDKAIKTYKLDLKYLLRIIDRHSKKVEATKNKGDYKIKIRPLSELFGQKKKDSEDLICADYLDEVYKEVAPVVEPQKIGNYEETKHDTSFNDVLEEV